MDMINLFLEDFFWFQFARTSAGRMVMIFLWGLEAFFLVGIIVMLFQRVVQVSWQMMEEEEEAEEEDVVL